MLSRCLCFSLDIFDKFLKFAYSINSFQRPRIYVATCFYNLLFSSALLLSTFCALNFSNYLGAYDYISTCIDAQMLSYDSYSNRLCASEFKQFLANENTFINGFNDELRHSEVSHLDQNSADDNSTIEQLKKENEELKVELLGKERRIKELESIQTSIEDESKLGRTRAENNAAKLILALSELASIDISKPYAPYESLKTQGELLGIDKFPSDENVATWLKRANAQKS